MLVLTALSGRTVCGVPPDEPEDLRGSSAERSPEDVAAAREALNEARRRAHLPLRDSTGDESLESARIAYEMELAEHRSTTERAHQAELGAKDATIAQLRYETKDLRRRLAEAETEAERLRIALQVLTGRPLPGQVVPNDDEASAAEAPGQPTHPHEE